MVSGMLSLRVPKVARSTNNNSTNNSMYHTTLPWSKILLLFLSSSNNTSNIQQLHLFDQVDMRHMTALRSRVAQTR